MVFNSISRKTLIFVTAALLSVLSLSGCKSPEQYKTEADEEAYRIIDNKWDDEFGPKVNYKISDVDPDPNSIKIDKELPLPTTLTLAQAVALATANNRNYQSQKEALFVSALDLGLERHSFENQYFGGGLLGFGKSDLTDDEAIAAEANFGFNRLLESGARISVNVAMSWAEILLSDGGRITGGWTPLLGFSIVQPLLRGSDREIVLENLTQAERDTLYEIRAFNRYRKEFVVSIITQYYQDLLLFDVAQNSKKNYHSMAWVYRKTKTLSEAGRVPKYEASRAKQDALEAMDMYLQARKAYMQSLDEFKISLGLPTTTNLALDESELERLKSAKMEYPVFSEDDAVKTAIQRRLDLVNSADFVIDAQRKIKVAEDGLRAELNIGLDIAELGRQGVDLGNPSTLSSQTRSAIDYGDPDPINDQVRAALEMDLPLERESEKNIYRKALIALSRSERQYDLAKDLATLQIRQAHRDLIEAGERYRIQNESLKLAKKRFDDTYLMLKYGRASSRRVLSAQSDLYDAQNATSQAMVNFTVATLNFYRDSGVLRVQPDGMWKVNPPSNPVASR